MSNFWESLDHARNLLRAGGATQARSVLARLQQSCAEDVPPAQIARRRTLLADFLRLHGLATPVPLPNHPEGTTLVSAVMDRADHLLQVLPTWCAIEGLSELVIVDWSSQVPLRRHLRNAGIDDPRLRIIRVDDAPQWHLTAAFNLGFRLARHARIIKADADLLIDPAFLAAHPITRGQFVAGNWRRAVPGQGHVNGFFHIHHADLMQVGGFNEYLTGYGWDDDDLYTRLTDAAQTRHDVSPGLVTHLQHDDALRLGQAHQAEDGWGDLERRPIFAIRRNRSLAGLMPLWHDAEAMMSFTLEDAPGGPDLTLRRADPAPPTPPHMIRRARIMAARELLGWHLAEQGLPPGLAVQPDDAALDLLLRRKRLEEIAPQDLAPRHAPVAIVRPAQRLYIDAQHGLGNRLRAIGSAGAIAVATGRKLVIVWGQDDHCGAAFHDLFDHDGEVLGTGFAPEAAALGLQCFNYMETEAGAVKDAPLRLREDRDVYLRSAYVLNHPASNWKSENAFLAGLRPITAVTALMPEGPFEIGVHIRMQGGDDAPLAPCDSAANWHPDSHVTIRHWRGASHHSRFIERLAMLLHEMPQARIFLATDHPEAAEALQTAFGDRVTRIATARYDRSPAQMQIALAEMLTLARCKTFLGSHWSGFSEAVLRLSRQIVQSELAGVDF